MNFHQRYQPMSSDKRLAQLVPLRNNQITIQNAQEINRSSTSNNQYNDQPISRNIETNIGLVSRFIPQNKYYHEQILDKKYQELKNDETYLKMMSLTYKNPETDPEKPKGFKNIFQLRNEAPKIQTDLDCFLVQPQNEKPSINDLNQGFTKQFRPKLIQSSLQFKQDQKLLIKEKEHQKGYDKKGKQIIDLSKMTSEQYQKTMLQLAKGQNVGEKQQREQRQQDALNDFAKKLNDQSDKAIRQKQVQEFMKEEMQQNYDQAKLRKKQKNEESKRLNTYNRLLKEQIDYQQKTSIVEYNLLLKYLFQRSYSENENEDIEQKIIPTSFNSPQEYTKIFEYLFLNESFAQVHQELKRWLKEKHLRYRKLQVKIDESMLNKDGIILQVKAPDSKTNKGEDVLIDLDKPQLFEIIEDGGDSSLERDQQQQYIRQDGNCDLMVLKNYIVILAQTFECDINKFNNPQICQGSFIFGFLIDPHKSRFLHQLQILTFNPNKRQFLSWTEVILIPFTKISTMIREYMILKDLENVKAIAPIIYNPSLQRRFIHEESDLIKNQNIITNPGILCEYLKYTSQQFNHSQFKSIREIALIDQGICLLQGPPGTGKTHTLIGLVSVLYNYMLKMNILGVKKILICAPSNAAIDEVLLRIIKGGIKDEFGQSYNSVKAIRVGPIEDSNEFADKIRKCSLEDQAQRCVFQLEKDRVNMDQRTTCDLRSELTRIIVQIQKKEKKRNSAKIIGDQKEFQNLSKEIEKLYVDKRKIQSFLDNLKGEKRREKEKYQTQINQILDQAEIICCTLSSSGSEKLDRFVGQIEILIIDEAAQCTEPTNSIPLRLEPRKMVLVGDPKQLPATTFSPISNQTLYNRSLFERITQNDFKPYLLDIQYRMHSEIRKFPSKKFYENKLTDDQSVEVRTKPHENFPSQRVYLIDCTQGREETSDGNSFTNKSEMNIIVAALYTLRQEFPNLTIGVLSGYKAQVKLIKQQFKQKYPQYSDKNFVSINTIDSFQGQERDIIIFSCVRASQNQKVGFMSDQRRINVALTRAKELLIVVANCFTLCNDPCWKEYINDMIKRGLYIRDVKPKVEEVSRILLKGIITEEECKENNYILTSIEQPTTILQSLLEKESKNKLTKETYNILDFEGEVQNTEQTQNPIKVVNPSSLKILKKQEEIEIEKNKSNLKNNTSEISKQIKIVKKNIIKELHQTNKFNDKGLNKRDHQKQKDHKCDQLNLHQPVKQEEIKNNQQQNKQTEQSIQQQRISNISQCETVEDFLKFMNEG